MKNNLRKFGIIAVSLMFLLSISFVNADNINGVKDNSITLKIGEETGYITAFNYLNIKLLNITQPLCKMAPCPKMVTILVSNKYIQTTKPVIYSLNEGDNIDYDIANIKVSAVDEDSATFVILDAKEDPKFCNQNSDCGIKYNVLYNGVCSAGCFHNSVTPSSECDLMWEVLVADKCSCSQNKCITMDIEEEQDTEQIPVEVEPDKEKEVLNKSLLFYFYTETCPHCSGMEGELNKVKNELKISVVKSDVTKDSDLAKKYSIHAVPSLVFIKEDGSFIKREGRTDYLTIIEWIKSSSDIEFEEVDNKEEVIKKVYEIPKETTEEVTYFCNGCLIDRKCYPLGYRKSGEYCSDNNEFISQLDAEKLCDNNFECKSNVCVDGECISSGLLRQILDWLRGFFGG